MSAPEKEDVQITETRVEKLDNGHVKITFVGIDLVGKDVNREMVLSPDDATALFESLKAESDHPPEIELLLKAHAEAGL